MEFLLTEKYEEQTKHHGKTKCTEEEGLKIPSLKTGQISLSDIIAATIGEDARFCDDGEVQAPEIATEDLKFSFYFKDKYDGNNTTTNSNDATVTSNGKQYFDRNATTETDENSQHSTKFQKVPETDENSNTVDSFFKGEETTNNPTEEFNTNLGFKTVFENHDDFLASLVQPSWEEKCNQGLTGLCANGNTTERAINLSGDSDLEDSMHFVDPDDQSASCKPDSDNESPEPKLKKRRLSDVYPMSTNQYNNLNMCNSDLISLLYAEENDSNFIHVPQRQNRNNNLNRRRSFSGAPSGRLSRQKGVSKLASNRYKTPTFQRTRSFSEAFNSEKLTPISEGRQLDTSLSSLLGSPSENSQLSNNPFYEDLKCTILSDLSNSANDDCPRTLFDTICQGQNSDVYARERNLQSRFSSLQSKYPDEVRDLSSFYRQQSAEVETERFREIHDERFPLSYRNHLNRYYDNLLHMIMERVEKSLQLLSKAKKEPAVTVVQGFRPRPLLSRKAVSMMEEWYTRNYEHPYPSQTAVEALAAAGEITTEQVKKWFANKRNRSKNTRPMNEVVGMKRKRQFSARWTKSKCPKHDGRTVYEKLRTSVSESDRLLGKTLWKIKKLLLTRNYEHPYPSQTAVEALAAAGEITTEQVKKWFANKRNRSKNTRPMNEVVGMKRKRQFSARCMMEEWFTRNYEHPSPSQTAVEALAAAGEITTEQVKKWFANKRNSNKNTRPMNEVVGMKRKRQFSARW